MHGSSELPARLLYSLAGLPVLLEHGLHDLELLLLQGQVLFGASLPDRVGAEEQRGISLKAYDHFCQEFGLEKEYVSRLNCVL